jgi:hypothetical protein
MLSSSGSCATKYKGWSVAYRRVKYYLDVHCTSFKMFKHKPTKVLFCKKKDEELKIWV